jgi:hypothetical protein
VPDPGLEREDRTARQPRPNIADVVYHVTQRGVERRNIVVHDEDRQEWLQLPGRNAMRPRGERHQGNPGETTTTVNSFDQSFERYPAVRRATACPKADKRRHIFWTANRLSRNTTPDAKTIGWPGLDHLELPTFLQFVIGWQSLAGVSLGDGCLAVK